MKLGLCLAFGVFGLAAPSVAQPVDTQYFRAVLLPGSEVPAVSSSNRGVADVVVHVVRDSTGQVASGTMSIVAHVNFTASVAVTGMDIWKGNTGQNGADVISTGFSAQNGPVIQSGGDLVQGPAQISSATPAAMSALRDLIQNPSAYYLNILTATSPNGAVRGQLQKAQTAVLLAMMSTANLNPIPPVQGYGEAKVIAIGTRDANNNWTSGELFLSAAYSSGDGSAFTSFQIHQGTTAPTTTGALAATLPGVLMPDPSGAGLLGPYYTEISVTTATQTAAFSALFSNPSSLYIDLHTAANPGGLMLAPLRRTDAMSFPVSLSSANTVTAPSVSAAAPANLTLYTVRDVNGAALAGTFLTDIDYRFPGATQFIAVDISSGKPAQTGPVAVQLAADFYDATGIGNCYNWSNPVVDAGLLADLLAHPENYYVSMHTTSDPGGAVRAQLASAAAAGTPVLGGVISADLDVNATTLAPGELFSIFGTGLAAVGTDLSGWAGQTLPASLNGFTATLAGRSAPLIFVSPGQVNAQVPLDAPSGPQPLVVTGPGGVGSAYTIQVAPVAPAIFFYPVTAVLKNADYSLVTTANPAKSGDVLLIYCTGLGQTNPPMATGLISTVVANTYPVTATMGGKGATVVYSIASPSFPGLYQVAVTVPAGLTGAVPLVLQQFGANSNSVNIALH